MKVLMLNGSARKNGNTYSALSEIGKALNENGIDFEIINTGDPVRDCIGCGGCTENGCRFDDDAVNEFIKKAREADGFIFGTPVYYAHPSGRILSFLDRAFYSSSAVFRNRAAICSNPCFFATLAKKVYLFLACDSPANAASRFFSVFVPEYLFFCFISYLRIKILCSAQLHFITSKLILSSSKIIYLYLPIKACII